LVVEVFERGAEQRLGFAEAFVNPDLVLGVSPIYEGCEPFGHKPNLIAKVFDQNAGVTLDFFQPLVHFPTQLLELPVNRLESGIEVLNEFLIQGAPARERVG
jgi:hypothetical protein